MLIKFTVSNSRSIGEELEFSAIATNDSTLPEALIDVPKYGIKLLKTMALFGANASGKSNVLKAMNDVAIFVANEKEKPEKDSNRPILNTFFNYSKNNENNEELNIQYSFDILLNDIYYNYTFAHNSVRIISEILTEYTTNEGNGEVIYSRRLNEVEKNDWFFCNALLGDDSIDFIRKSTAHYELFLTIANKDFNIDEIKKNTVLEAVFIWFAEQIDIHIGVIAAGIHTDYDDLVTFIKKSKNNKKLLLNLAYLADIQITDIQIFELTKVSSNKIKSHTEVYPYTRLEDGEDVMVAIKTTHSTEKNAPQFDFFIEESNGTKQFLAWLGYWLLKMQEGRQPKIFVVDELGTSLHPLLTQLLVKIFYNKKLNPYNAQLIFTTHEVKLMDKKIMRSDQLYLVSKLNDNTIVERVSDYAESDKYNRLDNIYTQGALGAIANINENALNRIKI